MKMNCQDVEKALPFFACDELDVEERAGVAAHLEGCASCRQALAREERLLEVMQSGQAEPSPMLLVSCRNALSDALDEAAPAPTLWQRLAAWLRPPRWFALHPAWSGAMLLVIGVVVGAQMPRWFAAPPASPGQPVMTISPSGAAAFPDLRNLQNVSISTIPGADSDVPVVQVHGMAQQPLLFEGTPADENLRRVLTYVVQNNQRFDPGLRIDSVDLLKTQGQDAEVRAALCHAARHDRNPAVRLKALEALREMGQDAAVRQTLIDALLHDDNPGVRVEAITALRAIAEQGADDPRLLEVFRDRMQRDPSTFVRMQSAAAIRQLGPRASY
jgi:hypothetical protein